MSDRQLFAAADSLESFRPRPMALAARHLDSVLARRLSLEDVAQEAFACRRCGACCRIKDGIVRVSDAEVARIAAFLGMPEADFIATATDLSPDRRGLVLKSRPDGACIYLTAENLCSIQPVKPDKCRTFPRDWTNPDSHEVCPCLADVVATRSGQ